MSIRRSRFRGVVPTGDPALPWAARIQGDGRSELVPCATEEQAARAYDRHWVNDRHLKSTACSLY